MKITARKMRDKAGTNITGKILHWGSTMINDIEFRLENFKGTQPIMTYFIPDKLKVLDDDVKKGAIKFVCGELLNFGFDAKHSPYEYPTSGEPLDCGIPEHIEIRW